MEIWCAHWSKIKPILEESVTNTCIEIFITYHEWKSIIPRNQSYCQHTQQDRTTNEKYKIAWWRLKWWSAVMSVVCFSFFLLMGGRKGPHMSPWGYNRPGSYLWFQTNRASVTLEVEIERNKGNENERVEWSEKVREEIREEKRVWGKNKKGKKGGREGGM